MFDRTFSTVAQTDPETWAAIEAENRRQEEHIELIASENYASPAMSAPRRDAPATRSSSRSSSPSPSISSTTMPVTAIEVTVTAGAHLCGV